LNGKRGESKKIPWLKKKRGGSKKTTGESKTRGGKKDSHLKESGGDDGEKK